MKERVLKKLVAAIIAVSIIMSYCIQLVHTSIAAETNWREYAKIYHSGNINTGSDVPVVPAENTVTDWGNIIRSFPSIAYYIDGMVMQKWDFYDAREEGKYENLTCIRSGASQANTYFKHDLYHLQDTEEGREIFNELFKGNGSDEEANRRYQHVLWAIDNFYLFNGGDTPEEKQMKFNEFNNFIGATEAPYAVDDMADNLQLYYINRVSTKAPEKITNLNKNELILKALQSEILFNFIIQTYNRTSDPTPIYDAYDWKWNAATQTCDFALIQDEGVQSYVEKIVNKFMNIENSANYNVENINKYYNSNPEEVKVKLTETTDTVATDNISGSFFICNKYKAKVDGIRVYIDNNQVSDYKILNSENEDITTEYKNMFQNSATNEYEFKIQHNNLETSGTHTVRLELDVDYGYIITATLFEPDDKEARRQADGSYKGCQYVINLNKDHKSETVRVEGDATAKKFDLALTKEIIKVEDEGEEGIKYFDEDRNFKIDDEFLKRGESTNARYIMNKRPVYIAPGRKVIYSIKVYNEGELDGFAEEITDYLPEGLSFVEGSSINEQYGWQVDRENSKIVRTTYLSSNNNPNSEKKLTAYDKGFGADGIKEVQIECKVDDDVPNKTILDNRSEITKYGFYVGDEFVDASEYDIDRDSLQNSAFDDAELDEGDVENLIKDIATRIANNKTFNQGKDDKNKVSYEDDDDIERLIVLIDTREMDLALRKWIVEIDGTQYNREPKQLEEYENRKQPLLVNAQTLLFEDTLEYDNPKEAINVEPGSIVTYKLGIFNEGSVDAYAEVVTDYLPKGLEFVEDNKINKDYDWKATKNEDGTTTVTTTYLSKEKGNNQEIDGGDLLNSNLILFPGKAFSIGGVSGLDYGYAHKTLEIVCKVSENVEDGKYLTNRAEITKYGYYDLQNNWIECNDDEIDRDSREDNIKDNLNLDDWYVKNYIEQYNPGTPQTYFPGVEDDDDYETVKVEIKTENTDYSVQIKKVSAEDENKTIEGATFSIKEASSSEKATTSNPTGANGITSLLNKVSIDKEGKDNYVISETYVPEPYKLYTEEIKLEVAKKLVNNKYVLDAENTKVTGKDVKIDIKDNLITIIVPNIEKEFDFSLRKLISAVNDTALEGENSREPDVKLDTLINGDPKKNGEKTATYEHTKDPVTVNPTDVVEYTFRIFNEGEMDGYATRINDTVPAGTSMIAPEYDKDGKPLNKNAEYRWVMYREMTEEERNSNEVSEKSILKVEDKYYVETEKEEEAVLISTDYLSMENGERLKAEENSENPNLLRAFNGEVLDTRDIKVEYKVNAARDNKTIITNYAQISEQHGKNGIPVKDRDSEPNKWNEGEDDQDLENLKVNWFDLALYKWVSSTIVTEDGKTKEYASGHNQNEKEKIVNVTIAKDKLNKTNVKFKWTIKVENQSPIPGYATEVKDHIPAGLKFVEEDNKEFGWKLQKDGTITTDYLKNTLLQQGETAEVTVILTWVNGENNLGAKVNYAEISEDFNAYGAPDIDSVPNNFKGKVIEDDEDVDEVRLNVRTGNRSMVEYISITIGIIVLIAVGGIVIKKQVLDKEF